MEQLTDAYLDLVTRASACRQCPRMDGRKRVLSRANGGLQAEILFVAEAPGRLGADRSGIPLQGDQAGRNFEFLLREAGIPRELVFITNAVLCNPRDDQGRNATPTAREIGNCSSHLRETIDIIQPPYVVTLGNVALQALKIIKPHSAVLSEHVAHSIPWYGRLLVPLYHPGSRARVHRALALQVQDFRHLANLSHDVTLIYETRLPRA